MIERSLRLADGRVVEIAELGRSDAPPVVYFHGTPGSRREIGLSRGALERAGVGMRLIACNRPGYGRSTFVAQSGFMAFARDMNEIADQLGLDRFAVLGASGGSPHALACAQLLADRVIRVAIVAGVAPPDAPGMDRSATITQESTNERVRRARYRAMATVERCGLGRALVKLSMVGLSPPDREVLSTPEGQAAFRALMTEAFAQQGRAAANETGLFLEPWDVDLGGIEEEVLVCHGEQDNRIPPEVGRSLKNLLPSARLVLWPDHGHFSWAMSDELAQVVRFLTSAP